MVDDEELKRMVKEDLPDEIAAFIESRFTAVYDEILSKKPEILECLVQRIQQRKNPSKAREENEIGSKELSAVIADNGEGPSSTSGRDSGPSMDDGNWFADDTGIISGEPLDNFNWDLSLPSYGYSTNGDMQVIFPSGNFADLPVAIEDALGTYPRAPEALVAIAEPQPEESICDKDQAATWDDGYEKGNLAGYAEGFKAGKKAAEEARIAANSRNL